MNKTCRIIDFLCIPVHIIIEFYDNPIEAAMILNELYTSFESAASTVTNKEIVTILTYYQWDLL